MSASPKAEGVGAHVKRKEDERFLRGRGTYVGDIQLPSMQHVTFLRSPVAHARIRKVTKPAGHEKAVFVIDDLTSVRSPVCKLGLPGFKTSEYPPLAKQKVRFVGEPIAMCVAADRASAEDLAEQVEIEFDELPAVVDPIASANDPTALVHDDWGDNVFLETRFDAGIAEAARTAAVVVRRQFRTARQVINPLEGKAVLAYWDERTEQLTVYTATQLPHLVRQGLSEFLGVEHKSIRVIAPDVGGGFGYKCLLQPEELCVAWLALKYRKPFRWLEDRREHLVSGANCRDQYYDITAYADERGRLLGVDADVSVDAGAYSVWPVTSAIESTMAGNHLPGPYNFSAYRARTRSIATNKPPIVPYRGVSRTSICLAMELTIDAIARKVNREPWEVRMENLVQSSAMPFTNATGKIYDSGDYCQSLQIAVDHMDVPAIRERQRASAPNDNPIGVGFANYIEMSAHGTSAFVAAGYAFIPGYEQAMVRFTPDGGLEIRVGVHSHGQGMETTLAQIAHQVLDIPLANISVILGDTALTPYSTGTYASRGITMAGGAVSRACGKLLKRLSTIAAHLLQTEASKIRLESGRLHGPSGDVAVRDVAQVWYRAPHRLPDDVDQGGMEVTEGFRPTQDTGQFSYGTHAALVEVDRTFGTIKILKYAVVEDCGTIVNPLVVDGQIYGGTAQGIGTALLEEMEFDRNGQPLASTLADYMLPGAAEMPAISLFHIETPSPFTEFGIKGVGEGGAIPPPAAILNAVNDALKASGAEFTETPLTPRRLLAGLAAANEQHKSNAQ